MIEYCGECTSPDFSDCECMGIEHTKLGKGSAMVKLDKETIEKWKQDALKATGGEWWAGGWKDGEEEADIVQAEPHASTIVDICNTLKPEDRNHIANVSPKNFLALIEKLQRYEEALKLKGKE